MDTHERTTEFCYEIAKYLISEKYLMDDNPQKSVVDASNLIIRAWSGEILEELIQEAKDKGVISGGA